MKSDRKTYKTSKFIKVHIHEEDGLFFAENETLNVISYGETKEKALFELGLHLIYFVYFYKNKLESELIGDAIRLKKFYSDLLVEI